MATTGAYLDIASEVKNAYPSGTFPDAVNKEAPYRKSLNKVNLKMRDGIAVFPLNLEAAWNVGIIEDNTDFTAPIDPTRPTGTVKPEIFAGSFQLGLKSLKTLKDEKGSFQSGGILSNRIETSIADLGKWINIVYAGTVRGRLGTVEADGTNTITVAKPWGGTNFENNFRISVYNAISGGTVSGSLENQKVTDVNETTRVLTYAGSDRTVSAGDHIFMHNSYGMTPWTLLQIVDDGTYETDPFGTSRTTYPGLKSQVFAAGGVLRNLDEQLILKAILQTRKKSGKKVTRALSNYGQALKYVEFVSADRRYPGVTSGSQSYSIGFGDDALQIHAPGVNTKLEVDYNIVARSLFLLSWDTFGLYEAMAPDWIDEDSLLHLIPTSGGHKAGVLAYPGSIENQINTMPRGNARIDDLKDPMMGDV